MKRIMAAVLAAVMLCLLCSCGASEKDFSKAGMTITLTNKFVEKDLVTQTAYYESTDAIVTVLREGFDIFQQNGLDYNITKKQYAEMCVFQNNLTAIVDENEKYAHFSYQKEINGQDFSYEAYCFRTDDAFWLIQFACHTKNLSKMTSVFEKYANSVKFE